MAAYQISFDRRHQRDYTRLIERIKNYETWCRVFDATWIIVTDRSSVEVRDYLKAALTSGDGGLLVTRVNSEGAWYGLPSDISQWLKRNLVK